MYENPPKVLVVLLDAMIEGANLALVEKAQHPLLQLSAALAWDDFDTRDALFYRCCDDTLKLSIDRRTLVVDVMQIELELGQEPNLFFRSRGQAHTYSLSRT